MAETTGNETVSDITRAHSTPLITPPIPESPDEELGAFEVEESLDDDEEE